MDIPPDLMHDLLDLVSGTGHDDHDLGPGLAELVTAVRAAVPSYYGMRVTITAHDQTVHIDALPRIGALPLSDDNPVPLSAVPVDSAAGGHASALAGDLVATSLRLPLAALLPSPSDEAGRAPSVLDGHIVFYATTPGAFVDLAADLSYALHLATTSTRAPQIEQPDTDPSSRQVTIGLDIDLPPPNHQAGIAGLDEASTIDRAVGVLIAEGHLPEQALSTLQQQAAAAGVASHIYAARLLRR